MTNRKDSRGRVLEKGEYQRGDGRYQFSYTDPMGNRHCVYATDLASLRAKEKNIKLAQWQEVDIDGARTLTLDDLFDRYMMTKYGLKDSTYASYLDMYRRYVRDGFGRNFLKNIRYSDIQGFYGKLLREKNISIRTVEYLNQLLHPTFELAVRDGILLKNPTQNVLASIKQASSYSTQRRKALTIDQQKAFIEFIYRHPIYGRYHNVFKVMLGTGLRAGEFCGLRWEDIDFEKRVITVDHAVVMVRGVKGKTKDELHVSCPKTEAGIRTIPIMEPVMEAFKDEFIYGEFRGFPSVTIDGYTDFIFTNQAGNVYTCSRLDLELRNIVKAYNKREDKIAEAENREPVYLPNFSCHILRHTFCTRLCENDVNIKVIQTVMGHANIKITMDIYAEVSAEKQRREIERMATELDVF